MNILDHYFPEIPHLLCLWHINKDVLAYAREHIPGGRKEQIEGTNDWQESESTNDFMKHYFSTVSSQSEAEFDQNVAELFTNYPEVAAYFNTVWWPYKERFVRAWIDHYRHYEQVVTSRLKGGHHSLKTYLLSVRNGLLQLTKKYHQFVTQQLAAVKL